MINNAAIIVVRGNGELILFQNMKEGQLYKSLLHFASQVRFYLLGTGHNTSIKYFPTARIQF